MPVSPVAPQQQLSDDRRHRRSAIGESLFDMLVGVSISAFLLMGIAGIFLARKRIWKWVDVIYYPVAGAGVLLLFFSFDRSNSTREINEIRAEFETKIAAHLRNLPNVDVSQLQMMQNISDGYEVLGSIISIDYNCKAQESQSSTCAAARILAPRADGIVNLFDEFLDNSLENWDIAAIELCTDFTTIIDDLISDSSVAALVFEELSRPVPASSDMQTEAEPGLMYFTLQRRLLRRMQSLGAVLEVEGETNFGTFLYYTEMITNIAMSYNVCLVLPEDVANFDLARWRIGGDELSLERDQMIAAVQEEAEEAHQAAERVRWWRQEWWPYLILLALALKFGKGVADLRSAHRTGV